MAWEDSEINLHRSGLDPTIWAVNIPTAEIAQIFESMGKLRAVKQWVIDNADHYGYDLGERRRWVKDNDRCLVLEIWVP